MATPTQQQTSLFEHTKEQLVEEIVRLQNQVTLERRQGEQLKRMSSMDKQQQYQAYEQEQEYITNNLLKQLADLRKERERLQLEVKHEGQDLQKLNNEKVQLEQQREVEQEYIYNKLRSQVESLDNERNALKQQKQKLDNQVLNLQKKVQAINIEKIKLENELEMEEENIVNKLLGEKAIQNMRISQLERELEQHKIVVPKFTRMDSQPRTPKLSSRSSQFNWEYSRSRSSSMSSTQ